MLLPRAHEASVPTPHFLAVPAAELALVWLVHTQLSPTVLSAQPHAASFIASNGHVAWMGSEAAEVRTQALPMQHTPACEGKGREVVHLHHMLCGRGSTIGSALPNCRHVASALLHFPVQDASSNEMTWIANENLDNACLSNVLMLPL